MNTFTVVCLIITLLIASSSAIDNDPIDFANRFQWRRERISQAAATPLASRLPPVIRPIEYNLRVQPYFPAPGVTIPTGRNMTFDGYLRVIVEVFAPTSNITMHARNLNISSSQVILADANRNNLTIQSINYNDELNQIVITPASALSVGQRYNIEFTYTGIINYYTSAGLYYTSFIDMNGNQTFMVATQFEPIDARSMYPSFDEPIYKAIFNVQLIYPTAYVALGNMPEQNKTLLEDGWSQIQFSPTPPMSNYLLAFAIGPFVSRVTLTPAGTIVRAWSWTGMETYLDFAADAAAKCLHQFGLYTNFTFPLPKSDQLGLPDFPAGAMENWGLVIYKYQYINYDPRSMPTSTLNAMTSVICHELAHQWFGDLITVKWWDDLFLNEGFATFFEYVGRMLAFPDQRLFFETSIVDDVMYALSRDADTYSTHPVTTITGPRFDAITYDKGSSLLRMINYTIGETSMRDGLRLYVQQNQFANANHEDLWWALTNVSQSNGVLDWCGAPINVSSLMDPWILQANFPLITVNNSSPTANRAIVNQQPYSNYSLLPPNPPFNYSWPVPIFYRNANNTNIALQWLNPEYASECISSSSSKADIYWELENAEARAFYRIEYDDEGWNRLINQLRVNPSSISLETKIQLLSDSLALITRRSSQNLPYSYQKFLDLTLLILARSINYTPFSVSWDTINFFARYFRNTPDLPIFQKYMTRLLQTVYTQLGWTQTNNWDSDIARNTLLPYAVRYEIGDAINGSIQLFSRFITACQGSTFGTDYCNPIDTDNRRAVYCAAIMRGPASNFDTLFTLFQAQYRSNFYFANEYMAQLEGLSCTLNVSNFNRYVTYVLSDPYLVSHGAIGYLRQNPSAATNLLAYITTNASIVFNSVNGFGAIIDAMSYNWFDNSGIDTVAICYPIQDPYLLFQLNQLNTTLFASLSANQRNQLRNTINEIETRITWKNANSAELVRWFYANVADDTNTTVIPSTATTGTNTPSSIPPTATTPSPTTATGPTGTNTTSSTTSATESIGNNTTSSTTSAAGSIGTDTTSQTTATTSNGGDYMKVNIIIVVAALLLGY